MKAPEIIGFPEPRTTEGQFELIAALSRERQVEIARLSGIAMRLATRFDAQMAIEFLHREILGRPPDRKDLLDYAERLNRTPSMVPIVVEELLALSRSQQ